MKNIELRQYVIAFGLLVVCMAFPDMLPAQGMSGIKEGIIINNNDDLDEAIKELIRNIEISE